MAKPGLGCWCWDVAPFCSWCKVSSKVAPGLPLQWFSCSRLLSSGPLLSPHGEQGANFRTKVYLEEEGRRELRCLCKVSLFWKPFKDKLNLLTGRGGFGEEPNTVIRAAVEWSPWFLNLAVTPQR